ncbi:MAG: SsrA-binding protein SmpB [Candidatus Uhrbacteria bacterium]|nr:SsrA-binding protein SmpB [Candidatus Uhrbacteria bacterium]
MKPYAENRKAHHQYEILKKFEGGLALTGAEAKSVREGGAKLDGAYVQIFQGELWLVGAHVRAYSKQGQRDGYDPNRRRKVLVHKKELHALAGQTQQKGLTLVPLTFYPVGRRIKVSFALCRGRKVHDKREQLKKRDIERQLKREVGS